MLAERDKLMVQGEKHILAAVAGCRKPLVSTGSLSESLHPDLTLRPVQKISGQGPMNKDNYKLTPVCTLTLILHNYCICPLLL